MEPRVFGNLLQTRGSTAFGCSSLGFPRGRPANIQTLVGSRRRHGMSHSRSIWGHTGIRMLQAPSAVHIPALGPPSLRLQGCDTAHVRVAWGKEILHFFPFFFYIWDLDIQVNHKLGRCCVWVVLGEFFAFFLVFHLQQLGSLRDRNKGSSSASFSRWLLWKVE